MRQLRPYQTRAIDEIAVKYTNGYRKLIFQLATGGGKTVTFAALISRFVKAIDKNIVIAVHREELLKQARRTLYEWYGIVAEPIVAGVKYRNPNVKVYVTMVETANNRLKKNPLFFGDVGLFIIDEAHLGNFTKLHEYFKGALTVGFTATPISSSKRNPLKNQFEDIVCGIDIPDLIAQRSLMPNKTFHVKGSVNRSKLKVKNGEFDSNEMSAAFGTKKHIHNCVDAYEKHAIGTKTIIFNCNVEHSKLVTSAFIDAGYESRHLDGTAPDHLRTSTLKWFAETPNAILNNIGILTTGFDEPSVQTVIVNRATMSLPLWLQMTGRGSRPHAGKDHFTILDLGGNALSHGDWCSSRDWHQLFHNPDKPGDGGGVAPIKECEHCEAIMHASAKICPECGKEQSVSVKYDTGMIELELLSDSINIAQVVDETKKLGRKDYHAIHETKRRLIEGLSAKAKTVSDDDVYRTLELFQNKVREWCQVKGRNYDQWHKEMTAKWFFDDIKKVFKWEPQMFSLEI